MYPISKQSLLSFSLLIAVSITTGWFLVRKINETQKILDEIILLQNKTAKSVIQSAETIDTSNWKTYRNEEFGFEVRIPSEWEISRSSFSIDPIGTIFTKNENVVFFVISKNVFVDFSDYIANNEPVVSLKIIEQSELNESNVKHILGLNNWVFPDGFTVSFKISKLNAIHSDFVNKGYEYEYLVYEKKVTEKTLIPMRKFNGLVWKAGNKIYILQNQTQISDWNINVLSKISIVGEKLFLVFMNFKTL